MRLHVKLSLETEDLENQGLNNRLIFKVLNLKAPRWAK